MIGNPRHETAHHSICSLNPYHLQFIRNFRIKYQTEPNATLVEQEGYGYIVASLGELGGVVPYTAYNARKSFIENNPNLIKSFTKAIQKGLDFVNTHTSIEIAEVIKDEFPDTSISDLATVIERYKSVDTWPDTTLFTEESFNHLQDIMINAGELKEKVNYNDLVYIK